MDVSREIDAGRYMTMSIQPAIVIHGGSGIYNHAIGDYRIGIYDCAGHDGNAGPHRHGRGKHRVPADCIQYTETQRTHMVQHFRSQAIVAERDECVAGAIAKQGGKQAVVSDHADSIRNRSDGLRAETPDQFAVRLFAQDIDYDLGVTAGPDHDGEFQGRLSVATGSLASSEQAKSR